MGRKSLIINKLLFRLFDNLDENKIKSILETNLNEEGELLEI